MRPVVWGLVLASTCGLMAPARADIYRYRDRGGVLHLTNAPTVSAARPVLTEGAVSVRVLPVPPPLGSGLMHPGFVPLAERTAYDALIHEVAERYHVEYALVKAVIKAESDFDHRAVSRKGALGLMQLMPVTAAQHQVRNVFLPRDNIEGGCRHLRMLLDRYGGNLPLSIAAYNAGIQRVEDAGGVPAIAETREYLARVLRYRLAYLREGVAGVLEVRR